MTITGRSDENGIAEGSAETLARRLVHAGFGDNFVDHAFLISSQFKDHLAELNIIHSAGYSEIPELDDLNEGGFHVWKIQNRKVPIIDAILCAGHSGNISQNALPVRVLYECGVRRMVVVGVSYPLDRRTKKTGVIRDHINLLGANPLIGPNQDRYGKRFPDMSSVYSTAMANALVAILRKRGLSVEERATLVASPARRDLLKEERAALSPLGPCYLTDTLVPEIIAAGHAEMDISAFVLSETTPSGYFSRTLLDIQNTFQ